MDAERLDPVSWKCSMGFLLSPFSKHQLPSEMKNNETSPSLRGGFAKSLIAPAIFATLFCPIAAKGATVVANSDTFITQHTLAFGPANTTHGAADILHAIGLNGFRSFPLVEFDLSSFFGQTIVGDATFSIGYLTGSGSVTGFTVEVTVHKVLVGWAENTVTFTNFNPDSGTSFTGTFLDTKPVASPINPPAPVPANILYDKIPRSLVQEWIDTPAGNHGLILKSAGGVSQDLQFASRENSETAFRPTLTFTAVPEPGTSVLVALAGIGMVARRRRETRV